MPDRSRKRPRDPSKIAKLVVDIATGAPEDAPQKNAAAVALGRLGGKKGGVARAKKLSAEARREIASKAAKARWGSGGVAEDGE